MKITLINGIPQGDYAEYEKAVDATIAELSKTHEIDQFKIRDMDISYCCGCFSCWTKTPGKCVYKDDMHKIYNLLTKTDLLLIVSPITTGFITSEAKKMLDRVLPIALPYIRIKNGECHHMQRYSHTFDLGLLLLDEQNANDEMPSQIFEWIDRLALNVYASKVIKAIASKTKVMEVLTNEISNY